ncbi:MAG TPA: hypothetical protein VME22_24020 [Solirubrobacteraceae bacterium]|nr:hypothetical protein [Solirubrobacteraceae bacterium]
MRLQLTNQTSTVLLACGRPGTLAAERPRLRDRLAAQWGARRLDRALAEGVSPEANTRLALRAQRLTEPDRRWSIAGALRRIIREADQDRLRLGRMMPVRPDPGTVRAASHELNALADTLDDPGPVAAHGVAQAWLLITDGTGPLYHAGTGDSLSVRAAQAARQLRPWAV